MVRANFGNATVRTVSRRGYAEACPNAAKLFSQIAFTVDMENTVMTAVEDGEGDFSEVAATYLRPIPRSSIPGWTA